MLLLITIALQYHLGLLQDLQYEFQHTFESKNGSQQHKNTLISYQHDLGRFGDEPSFELRLDNYRDE